MCVCLHCDLIFCSLTFECKVIVALIIRYVAGHYLTICKSREEREREKRREGGCVCGGGGGNAD